MTDPSVAFQQAVYAALTAAGVTAFHTVPPNTPLPYAVIGQDLITPDDETTGNFWDVSATVHVFAASVPAMKTLAAKVADTLDRELTVTGFKVGLYRHESTRHLIDSSDSGLVPHAVVGLEYSLQSTAG
jgi:hypothetical protein